MFTHLRLRSEYSLLDSVLRIKDVTTWAVEQNSAGGTVESLGLMDHMSISGALDFSEQMLKIGIKPIIGISVNAAYNNHTDKLPNLGLLAKSQLGYKNLLKILHHAHFYSDKNSYGQNYIKLQDLANFAEGIICITGCYDGILIDSFLRQQISKAQDILQYLKDLFKDNLYIELTRHGRQDEQKIEDFLLDLATEHSVPLVATGNVFFYKKDHFEAYEAIACIRESRFLSEKDRIRLNDEYYLKSPQDMELLFSDIPEAIRNSTEIAYRCSFALESRDPILPSYQTTNNRDIATELREQSYAGLKQCFLDYNITSQEQGQYQQRLDYELEVIIKMDFAGYFLIVADFIKWAKDHDIPVGPGRGSGVGSIAAWSLSITDADPVKYELLFERFLNPERVSMPDFDIDFCQSRREEVVEYVLHKYGKEKVASIMTFGTLQARAVLKDVGRVMQIPYLKVDEICKLIPFNALESITLEKAIAIDPKLQEQRLDDPDIQKLIDISLVLEGLYRHTSTHAAGIIIANEDILKTAPVYKDENSNIPILALNMKSAQKMGFVKFDFLGLKTLTTIAAICKLVEAYHNVSIDARKIPLDDPDTFALLRKGRTKGIFQLEAPLPRETLQKIQVDKFEEIVAITSLNRPGPMENIPTYIKCKADQKSVNYMHDSLQDILKKTYGVIIYQEQVMQVAQALSNYSLASADLLRRAMGKKDKAEMELQKQDFIEGAKKNNIDPALSQTIFDTVAKFAGYGFNRSHAVAYSIISFQAAYLKAHFLVEFYIGTLNLDINNTEKINDTISDIQSSDIKIVLPDINKSVALFTRDMQEKAIIYSLSALKAMSLEAGNHIVRVRNSAGPFTDIFDFAQRCGKAIGKKQVENLIKSGCFDKLHAKRKQLIDSLDIIMKHASNHGKIANTNDQQQGFLFSDMSNITNTQTPKLLEIVDDYSIAIKINLEFEAIGLYLDKHPLDMHRVYLESIKITNSSALSKMQAETSNAIMAGVIVKIRQKFGKRGRFALLNLIDLDGPFEGTIFSDNLINQHRELLREGSLVLIGVFIKRSADIGVRLSINNICPIEDTKASSALILRHSEPSKYNQKKKSSQNHIAEYQVDQAQNPAKAGAAIATSLLEPSVLVHKNTVTPSNNTLNAEYCTASKCHVNIIDHHISIKFHHLEDSLSFIIALEELGNDGHHSVDIYVGDRHFALPKKYKIADIKQLTAAKPH